MVRQEGTGAEPLLLRFTVVRGPRKEEEEEGAAAVGAGGVPAGASGSDNAAAVAELSDMMQMWEDRRQAAGVASAGVASEKATSHLGQEGDSGADGGVGGGGGGDGGGDGAGRDFFEFDLGDLGGEVRVCVCACVRAHARACGCVGQWSCGCVQGVRKVLRSCCVQELLCSGCPAYGSECRVQGL